MKTDILRALAVVVLINAVSACSWLDFSSAPESELLKPGAIELFLARASLGAVEFEQYKYSDGLLYTDCGAIARGRFLPHGQNTLELEGGQQEEISRMAGKFLAFLASDTPSFAPAGANRSFADPGQFFLSIETPDGKKEVKTSLDSVSNEDGRAEKKMKEIAEFLRKSAASDHCGLKDFFGFRG